MKHWSQLYFGNVNLTEALEEAPVDYRVFASDGDTPVSHVAVTRLFTEIDGVPQTLGAVGGLFTVRDQMGRGYGNAVMDAAEDLVFNKMQLSQGILFCLLERVAFYERRGWHRVLVPVTLDQPSGEIATWPEEVMALPTTKSESPRGSIHISCKNIDSMRKA